MIEKNKKKQNETQSQENFVTQVLSSHSDYKKRKVIKKSIQLIDAVMFD